MYKSLISAIAIAQASALSITTSQEHHPAVDASVSTKELGIIGWQYFYDAYVDSLFSSAADTPEAYVEGKHICWFEFRVEQPFSGVDERYSIAVTHNCPDALIESIEFDITFESDEGHFIIDDHKELTRGDSLSATGLLCGALGAKTAAGSADAGDCGVWHPAGALGEWGYSYRINLADLAAFFGGEDASAGEGEGTGEGESDPAPEGGDADPAPEGGDADPAPEGGDADPAPEGGDADPAPEGGDVTPVTDPATQ